MVEAFLPNGETLGHLTAAGKWSKTKHSRQTRKQINSLLTDRIATLQEMQDPVEYYLNYLNNQLSAPKAVGEKREIKKISTEFNRLKQELDEGLLTMPQASVGAPDHDTSPVEMLSEMTHVPSSTNDPVKSLMKRGMPDFRKLLNKG